MYDECENEDHESQTLSGGSFTMCHECMESWEDRADDEAFESARDDAMWEA